MSWKLSSAAVEIDALRVKSKHVERGWLEYGILDLLINPKTKAHFESNYSSYYSNFRLIRTSIVATIILLEINGGPEHRYSSRLSGSLL